MSELNVSMYYKAPRAFWRVGSALTRVPVQLLKLDHVVPVLEAGAAAGGATTLTSTRRTATVTPYRGPGSLLPVHQLSVGIVHVRPRRFAPASTPKHQ